MSKRWLEADKKRRAKADEKKPKRLHATRADAAIAVVTRWLVDAGFADGDASGDVDVDDISWDIVDGEYVVRVPIRVGQLDIDEEMQKLEGE